MNRFLHISFFVLLLTIVIVAWHIELRSSLTNKDTETLITLDEKYTEEGTADESMSDFSRTESVIVENTRPILWHEVTDSNLVPPTIRKDIEDRTLIQLDNETIDLMKPGMTVKLIVPSIEDPLEVEVEQVSQTSSGNLTILGKINGNPWLDFVATFGESSSNATIGTEQGVFNLRGNRDLAWIASGRSFNHLVDTNVPDYRIPRYPLPTPGS